MLYLQSILKHVALSVGSAGVLLGIALGSAAPSALAASVPLCSSARMSPSGWCYSAERGVYFNVPALVIYDASSRFALDYRRAVLWNTVNGMALSLRTGQVFQWYAAPQVSVTAPLPGYAYRTPADPYLDAIMWEYRNEALQQWAETMDNEIIDSMRNPYMDTDP